MNFGWIHENPWSWPQSFFCWLQIGHMKFFDEGKIRCVFCSRTWDEIAGVLSR
jgi:hypothetical protein